MPGEDANPPTAPEEPTAEDAFALVSHELRTEILRVLGGSEGDGGLSFSAVRDRLDADVEPSQLHYHLQQLEGAFLEETDSGYRLRPAGIRLTLALNAGTFDPRGDRPPVDVDLDCHYCGGPVEAAFDPTGVKISCPDCERIYDWLFLDVPIEAFEDDAGAFSLSHFREFVALRNLSVARGFCPICANRLVPELYAGDDHPGNVCVHRTCGLCGAVWTMSAGQAMLADPAVIAFCQDHSVDVHSTPYWEFEFAEREEAVTVRSTDPWEVALRVTLEGDTLELIVDGELNVVERNHLDGDAGGSRSPSRYGPTEETSPAPDTDDAVELPDDAVELPDDAVELPDDTACLEALRQYRWPNEVLCVYCESPATTRDGRTGKGAQRYRCHDCERSFNDLTGTVFAERGLALPEMFHVVGAMDDVEATRIARHLDRSYNAVLDFVHDVRDARDADSDIDPSELVRLSTGS